jgi:signal transduction histidine kinase
MLVSGNANMEKNISITNRLDFLSGGGEMGERIRNFDWSGTPLGHPETWEQSLKTCVRIVLTSAQPMFVWWGPSLINIYNDSHAQFMGKKHPAGLGAKAADVWKEAWDILLPRIESVQRNEGTYDEALLFVLDRKGYHEEAYVSFCYSPVQGDDGTVKGLFCACSDNTERIVNERAVQTLRDLGAVVFDDKALHVIYRNVADALAKNNKDFPFAIIYEIDKERKKANAVASAGTNNKQYLLPEVIDVQAPTTATAEFCQAYVVNKLIISEKHTISQELPKGFWKTPATQFVYIPISAVGSDHPYAIIFAALNPYRPFDNHFKQFCELVGERVALEINKMLALEEERKRAEALEQIDKSKTVFFSNISHEFRTPLTLILNPLEELLNQHKGDWGDIEKQHLETVYRNALRLLKLVNTLLDFSSIESGRQQACYVPTDLVTLTRNLAANFRAVIEKAGMQLIIKGDDDLQPVYVDRQMWEKIVFNLLSNAFKYTLAGSITVELTAKDNYAILKIIDTGIGIPEPEVPHLFERFHRVQSTTGRTIEGTGIGLSLIKEFALLHKGDIGVESMPGRGSTFTVRIPLGKEHLPQQQIITDDSDEIITSAMYVEEAGTLLVKDNVTGMAAAAATDNQPLVLVVDDNADMREHLRSVLLPYFKIITASNGQEALQKIREQPPALILSDIMMPVLDGIGLLQQVKANKASAHIPVILLTARAGEVSKIMGWESGADDYLTKPFSSKELISRISSQIKTQQIRAEALTGIVEQKQYAKKLEEMNRELVKMNEELTSFAYVSSHDLQEPLRKIQMFSKRILEKEVNSLSEEGRNFFYRMDNAASRMQLLINDLLTYSRANTSQKHFEKTDLNLLLAEVKLELYEKVTATGTIIESESLPALSIIPFQFKQLFTNLIANSIKFARPNVTPHITIKSELVDGLTIDKARANSEKKYWHISLADNGTGFDPKFSEQIFGLFQRLHGRKDFEGTGIGLAIAKKVVENHNGFIMADGRENDGATIHLYLPAA